MMNVNVIDNGHFYVTVNGLIVFATDCLGDAYRHIKWMYQAAQQQFTVGGEETPVQEWIYGFERMWGPM